MNILTKSFNDLATLELYQLLKLRQDVFIFEQECICEEIDGRDPHALHVIAYDTNHQVIGTIRLIPEEKQVILGRVVTHISQRGTGLGGKMMERALDVCQQHYPDLSIFLTSQQDMETYYEKYGFKTEGPVFYYPKDHIPHLPMRRMPNAA